MGTLIVFVLTIPMGIHLLRRRQVALPPGFGLWLLFLGWVVASTVMLGYDPPSVVDTPVSVRLVSVVFTLACYLAVSVVLIYAGNLTEDEFPRQRLVRQLGALFCTVAAGGLLGVIAPQFQFTSLVEMLLPGSIRTNGFVRSLVHPSAAQVQAVLGFDSGRPAAPFGYTNMWGNSWFSCWAGSSSVGFEAAVGTGGSWAWSSWPPLRYRPSTRSTVECGSDSAWSFSSSSSDSWPGAGWRQPEP